MTTINEPRWIPAAEKEGGLVFGDILSATGEPDDLSVVLDPSPSKCDPWLAVVFEQSTGDTPLVSIEDLLVRIDPLPESTDAFRRGYHDGWTGAADWISNGQSHGDEANYEVIDAVVRDLRSNTPTEAADGE